VIDLPGPVTLFSASPHSLKILAALLWYGGGLVLLTKGLGLLTAAIGLQAGWAWPAVAPASALLFGSLKVHYIFKPSCRRNLLRIAGLRHPKLWQFYRPGFFVFLCAMIVLGRYLSNSVQDSYAGLLALATLDLSLAAALFGSSCVFWQTPTQPYSQPGDQSRL
jgi:hypothetical protein